MRHKQALPVLNDPPTNETILQGFEWYCPPDGGHWRRLAAFLGTLSGDFGVTKLWLPPATKGGGGAHSNGYDVYDLYDLGEFDQKGSTATKWGARDDLLDLAGAARRCGVGLLFDAVLNHKAAADSTETALATRVDPEDRQKALGKPEEIVAWTKFDFPGRHDRHSSFRWNKAHFTGVDYDDRSRGSAIWLLEGKKWADDVDKELGNFDYLMFADIDHSNPEVRQELFRWAEWLDDQVDLAGLRLDAIKHYSRRFVKDLLSRSDRSRENKGKQLWFILGEYVSEKRQVLEEYIKALDYRVHLFDFPLLNNFHRLSFDDGIDLRTVFDGALCATLPVNAVTFVANHDTQTGQMLQTPISDWFRPIAYALILLRAEGIPCVFYGDIFGCYGPSRIQTPPMADGVILPKLMRARQAYAYGTQTDYFDDELCVGFVRAGRPGGDGLAVVINAAWTYDEKRMSVGQERGGEVWTDLLRTAWGEVVVDGDGLGVFRAAPRSVAVWRREGVSGEAFTFGW